MSIWDNSSYLDATGYGLTTAATPEQAFGVTNAHTATTSITMALVLPRTADPSALLGESWSQREAVLNGLTPAQVGALYGADPAQYAALTSYIATVPGATLLTADQGYVSSAESRTVWVSMDAQAFKTLFGQTLLNGRTDANTQLTYWDGNLTPNAALGTLAGLWPQYTRQPDPTPQDTNAVTLTNGPQGVGNTAGGGYGQANTVAQQQLFPNQVASEYNFPLSGSSVATPTVGLLEPGIGTAVPAGDDPNQLVQQYRASAGVSGTGTLSDGPAQAAGTVPSGDERSLDVGIVAAAAPNSDIVAEAGAGDPYSSLVESVWGGGAKLSDISSSFRIGARANPDSPFFAALQGLYQDVALNNISLFQASGDGGSSALLATGVPQVNTSNVSTYSISVGGTSTSSQAQVAAAGAADTGGAPNVNAGIAALAQQAQSGNVGALETLVAGGLTRTPTGSSNIADFLQTTWNAYLYNASTGTLTNSYTQNYSSGGGVDPAIPVPSYQTDAGIDPQALAQAAGIPDAPSGKGDPDVSALAGGNTRYVVPTPDLTGLQAESGTSASAPLWAALSAKIQAVFADQGLPSTGYFNDLLYQAAVIDPGAFDDVRFGSNISSFYTDADGTIVPTGLGYSAGTGYDLTTGLGTPNGILLGRALTQIAQAQIYSPNATPVTDATGQTSATTQVLIVQPTLARGFAGSIAVGGKSFTPGSAGSGQGWSAQIAQQTLQSGFDPALVKAIAGQAQASSTQVSVAGGQALSVSIGGVAAAPTAQADTTGFGYVTYGASGQSVTLARPLAVAETYGGRNDTDAILRVRQGGADADSLGFYRVDDLSGAIGGVAPGSAAYAAAAASRAYVAAGGETSIAGPGQDQFLQTNLTGVNNGDIIGFELTDSTTGRVAWGLAAQNGGTNDLWSYGADTFGFDDGSAGGQGFDSMVFQLDFTSNAGSGLLASDAAPACYCEGTLIRTIAGEVAVERLAVGDVVVTASGAHRPVRWIGRRTYAGRFVAANPDLLPVRIRAGAIAEGVPARDLRVSPRHAIHLDGLLIPAALLIDGVGIVRESEVDSLAYWHVELDSHDILIAENLPAESFVDDDSRGVFHNAASYEALYPDAGRRPAVYCAPRVEDGYALAAIRRRLAERTRAREPALVLTGARR